MGLFEESPAVNFAGPPEEQWETISMVIDSGAAESVAPVGTAAWMQAMPSDGSKRGQTYLSASGERLANLGEKRIPGITNENRNATATFQIAEVTRALCSVSKICDQGNEVHFHAKGGYITNRKGQRTHFKRDNNVYVLELHTKVGSPNTGFPRPS